MSSETILAGVAVLHLHQEEGDHDCVALNWSCLRNSKISVEWRAGSSL